MFFPFFKKSKNCVSYISIFFELRYNMSSGEILSLFFANIPKVSIFDYAERQRFYVSSGFFFKFHRRS